MSRHNLRPTRAALPAELVVGVDVDVDVDYLPPVNPARPRLSPGQQVMIPAQLWDAVRADVLADRDRARGEFELLAPPGSPAGHVGDARVKQWSAMHPGYVALIEWLGRS